ncbi:MAG: type II toxin-antitoxin system RelE/ParE family toxin [Brevundimonas sp.]
MRVRLTRQANLDIRRQIDWLTERSPRSAEEAARAIFDTIEQLRTYPLSGRQMRNGEREIPVRAGQSGFVIRYQARRSEVVVVRIFHGAQDRR